MASRRRLLLGLGAVALAHALPSDRRALAEGQEGGGPTLYVYLHTDSKAAALASTLRNKLPALQVTVFGKFRDLEQAVADRRPDALLALHPVLASQQMPVALQGLRAKDDHEAYALVSTNLPAEGSLSGKVIGAVDLLGRDGTQRFVSELLETADVKLKRVIKFEDLLPLLQFAAADAVLTPREMVKSMADSTQLPLRVRELPGRRVGLPALGVLNPQVRGLLVKQIQGLDRETNRSLGVETWRSL